MSANFGHVLVTGGAGYVGSNLVPKFLDHGYQVTVLDLYIYGVEALADCRPHPNLTEIKGDLRDPAAVGTALEGCDAVVHLACISNDPSFELDPELGKSINYDCLRPFVRAAKEASVRRFIFASSSSVYGIKSEANVTEDLPLEPLTDYSKYKVMGERVLDEEREPGFVTLTLRPATVCGYAPRLRLDVTVNLLTNHAITQGKVRIFGGRQLRPNIHIEDMTDLYVRCLEYPDEMIDGKVFNAGYENHSVMDIAQVVRDVVGNAVEIAVEPNQDRRSYHISSDRIKRALGFVPRHTIADAVRDLKAAFEAGKVPDAMSNDRYYNIRRMQAIALR